ncbi:hypothetical protein [Erwinia aphidicola]|uniref:baseplate complex protein n=1 Tax=Erwinia aphidicola TaxID=68334 RepID=UPI0030186D63
MSETTMLALDGEGIRIRRILVSPSMQFQEKDQSGQTSSTANAEQGIKAKELRVSGLIPFEDELMLQRLFQLASAVQGSGALKKYRVANETAKAINFREATFTGTIDATPQEDLLAWQVSFTLREKISVPEKRETRKGNQTAATKQGGPAGGAAAGEGSDQLSWFERKVLKPVNDALG